MEAKSNKFFIGLSILSLFFCLALTSDNSTDGGLHVIGTNESLSNNPDPLEAQNKIDHLLKDMRLLDEKIYKNERKLEYITAVRSSRAGNKKQFGAAEIKRRQFRQNDDKMATRETSLDTDNFTEPNMQEPTLEDAEEFFQNVHESDSREYQFLNKLLKKKEFSVSNIDFGFLLTKAYNQNAGTYLLLLLLKNNSLTVMDNIGQIVSHYDIGHNANKIHVAPFMDEYLFVTYGLDNKVKVHLLTVDKELEAKPALYNLDSAILGMKLKPFSEILLEDNVSISALVSHMLRGLKFIFISDNYGKIQVFHKNGTIKSHIQTNENNITLISMIRHYSAIVYASPTKIGFLNIQALKPQELKCPKLEADIVDVAMDPQNNQIIFVLLKNLKIYAFEIKVTQEGACKLTHVFTANKYVSKMDLSNEFKLLPTRIYLFLLDSTRNSFLIFNTTDIASEDYKPDTPFNSVILRKSFPLESSISYVVHKNSMQSTYFACVEKIADRSDLHIFEMITPVKPVTDILSYIRMPIIIIAILGVFGYQYWVRKKKTNVKGKPTEYTKAEKFAKKHMDDLSEDRISGSKYGGKNDFRPDEKKKIEKYQESLDFLNKKTQELASSLDKLKSSGGSPMKIKELQETLDSLRKLE